MLDWQCGSVHGEWNAHFGASRQGASLGPVGDGRQCRYNMSKFLLPGAGSRFGHDGLHNGRNGYGVQGHGRYIQRQRQDGSTPLGFDLCRQLRRRFGIILRVQCRVVHSSTSGGDVLQHGAIFHAGAGVMLLLLIRGGFRQDGIVQFPTRVAHGSIDAHAPNRAFQIGIHVRATHQMPRVFGQGQALLRPRRVRGTRTASASQKASSFQFRRIVVGQGKGSQCRLESSWLLGSFFFLMMIVVVIRILLLRRVAVVVGWFGRNHLPLRTRDTDTGSIGIFWRRTEAIQDAFVSVVVVVVRVVNSCTILSILFVRAVVCRSVRALVAGTRNRSVVGWNVVVVIVIASVRSVVVIQSNPDPKENRVGLAKGAVPRRHRRQVRLMDGASQGNVRVGGVLQVGQQAVRHVPRLALTASYSTGSSSRRILFVLVNQNTELLKQMLRQRGCCFGSRRRSIAAAVPLHHHCGGWGRNGRRHCVYV